MPYVGGVGAYRRICDEVVAKGYEGFGCGEVRSHAPAEATRLSATKPAFAD